jgi:hypothetical protein
VTIPPELQTKGGPCHYKAIFVGYDKDWVGWHIRNLKGVYQFSCDVIFNETIPGCLSSLHSSSTPTPFTVALLPSAWPAHLHVCTATGQAYDEVVHNCDLLCASCHSKLLVHGGVPVSIFHSFCVIQAFVLLVVCDTLLYPITTWSLDSESLLSFGSYSFLTTPPD